MNKFKFYYLFAFLTLGILVSSCGDDDDDHDDENAITISIEPANGETITDCNPVHIHVEVTATVENHEVEIILHPDGNVDEKIINHDQHSHDMEISFEQDVNLCGYPAGSCFHLDVTACVDHDCEETATASAEFCLQ